MNPQECVDELMVMLAARDVFPCVVDVTYRPHKEPRMYIENRDDLSNGNGYIFLPFTEDGIAKARAYILAIPTGDDRKRAKLIQTLADATEAAKECDFDDAVFAPIREALAAVSSNLLEDKR